ncbi:MAG TPA: hypothetical protein VF950_22840 [Planctomycetota bacterium]
MIFSRSSQRGFSLATTLVLVTLVGGIASALIILSNNQMSVDQKTRDKVRATYIAEAGVEYLAHVLRRAHADNRNLTMPTASSGETITVDGNVLECRDYKSAFTLSDGSIGLSPAEPPVPDGVAEAIFTEIQIDNQRIQLSGERFLEKPPPVPSDPNYDPLERQTTTIMYSLIAELRYQPRTQLSTDSVDQSLRRTTLTSLGRVVRVMEFKITPIFDKFAFWDGDLEILPGPKAIFNGRIHTNKNLYIGAGGGLDINTDYIRANGDMYRHRLDNPSGSAWAEVTIRDPYADPYAAQGQLGPDSSKWVWDPKYESKNDYNTSWDMDANWLSNVADPALAGKIKNNDNESSQKLQLQPPAKETSIDVNGFYHENADIVIVDTKVYQRQGSDLVDITSTLPAGTVADGSVFDAREDANGDPNASGNGTAVPTTVIDMGKLQTGSGFPANGVIYAYRTKTKAASGGDPRVIEGVQLVNGKTLANDLTFVTNGPVYVQGDYNVDIPADASAGTPANPRKGAAIMGDAVNLLSNGWDGSKTKSSSPPAAKETTYNFALVTGNTPTDLDQKYKYSGGLENLPRFHENWGGVKCNYQGALMCLWKSTIATGRWGKDKVYSPPNRNWDFDARFGDPDATAKPPMFPQTVSIDRTTYVEGYPTSDE